MKILFFALGLALCGTARASSPTGWYCEAFCSYQDYTQGNCYTRNGVIESEGGTPVQAITNLRSGCFGHQNDTYCSKWPSKVTAISQDNTDSGKEATIQTSCKAY